jgi:hypothetical protein
MTAQPKQQNDAVALALEEMKDDLDQVLAVDSKSRISWLASDIYKTICDALQAIKDQQAQPVVQQSWRCFHCDEVFTDSEQAALHFGVNQAQKTACQFDVKELRETEALMRRYQEEDTDLHRELYALRSKHQTDLRREEEKGYARGLKDGKAYYAPVDQQAHYDHNEGNGLAGRVQQSEQAQPVEPTINGEKIINGCTERGMLGVGHSVQPYATVDQQGECKQCPHVVGDAYQRDCAHPDCANNKMSNGGKRIAITEPMILAIDFCHDGNIASVWQASHSDKVERIFAIGNTVEQTHGAMPVMADGKTTLYGYLKDAVSDDVVMDDWTKGYEECKRRLFKIVGEQLQALNAAPQPSPIESKEVVEAKRHIENLRELTDLHSWAYTAINEAADFIEDLYRCAPASKEAKKQNVYADDPEAQYARQLRLDVIEECAKVCEALYEGSIGEDRTDDGIDCANAIRQLKEQTPESNTGKEQRNAVIEIRREGSTFWHENCEGHHFRPPMKEIKREPDKSLIKCTRCGKQGYYPVGRAGTVFADEVKEQTQALNLPKGDTGKEQDDE